MTQETLSLEISNLVKELILKGTEYLEPQYLVENNQLRLENEKLKLEIVRLSANIAINNPIKLFKLDSYPSNMFKDMDVNSSSIKNLIYDINTQILYVTFRGNKKTYLYENVDFETYSELKDAHSIGKYFYQNIRNSYSTKEVSALDLEQLLNH